MQSFEDLDCWRSSRDLRLFIAREVLPVLPACERFRLADQMLRAARSITANIAEGHGRYHFLDKAKFCRNARGSCSELLDHCITAVDEQLITDEIYAEARSRITRTHQILNGYISYLQRSATRKPAE